MNNYSAIIQKEIQLNLFCQPQVSFLPTILAIPQFLIKGFPPKEDPKLSFEGNKSPREKERESVANLIRGSYNGPQYIVTLQSPESVAKHSISPFKQKTFNANTNNRKVFNNIESYSFKIDFTSS